VDQPPTYSASDEGRAHQLALLVDSVEDYAIFMLDPDGVIVSWNRGAARIKGYAAEEIIGRHFSAFYTDEDRARDHPGDELRIASSEGRFEEEAWRVRKDGSRFWANVVITRILDESGALIGFGKITRDLTARRLREEQLRNQAADLEQANRELEQFRLLVAGVRDYAIFVLDAGGHVATWNAGAEHMKGYDAAEVVGRHFSLFYTPEDRDRGHPAEELVIAAREGRYEEEGWRVRKDGSRFWANVLITALRNDHGTLIGFAKVTRDLTERRAADEAVRRVNQELRRTNEELQEFASAAAHDLQEPLRTISGFAELLGQRYGDELPGDARVFLDRIGVGTLRMRDLIQGFLAYAGAGTHELRRERVEIARLVAPVLDGLSGAIEERGAQVELDVDGAPAVHADPPMVEIVLQNLVSNAIKYAGDGPPLVRIAAAADGDAVRVEVSDNGIGIDPAEHAAVFESFRRVQPAPETPGTGLGLSIARRIVQRHGGRFGVESAPGQGSRFWFTLPAAEPDAGLP
jgi:PAS domain S-box-containing protein